MKRHALCCLALFVSLTVLPVSAQQQAADKPPLDLNATIDRIISAAQAAKKAEAEVAARLNAGKMENKALTESIAIAEKNLTTIKSLIDTLDANYDALSDEQKDTVREAWDIAELFGAFLDNQKETMTEGYAKSSGFSMMDAHLEAKVNAECAVRRATMLEEILTRLRK